jgi:hypothetical protein
MDDTDENPAVRVHAFGDDALGTHDAVAPAATVPPVRL